MIDYQELGSCHPKLTRGQVWCKTCGRPQRVDGGVNLRGGWSKCCGYTPTWDDLDETGGSTASTYREPFCVPRPERAALQAAKEE